MIKFSLIHHTWQARAAHRIILYLRGRFFIASANGGKTFFRNWNFLRLFFIRGNFLTLCSSNFRGNARKSEENIEKEAFVNNIKVCLEDICSGTKNTSNIEFWLPEVGEQTRTKCFSKAKLYLHSWKLNFFWNKKSLRSFKVNLECHLDTCL